MNLVANTLINVQYSLFVGLFVYIALMIILAVQRWFTVDKLLYMDKDGNVKEMYKCHRCGKIQSSYMPHTKCGGDYVLMPGKTHNVVYWCYYCNNRSVTKGVYAKWTGWTSIDMFEFFNGSWQEYTQNREPIILQSGGQATYTYYQPLGLEGDLDDPILQELRERNNRRNLESTTDTPQQGC